MDNWKRVYSTNDLMQAKLAEDILKQNGIESHILNKPDSVLPPLGEAALMVPKEKVEDARTILQKNDFIS